MDLSLLLMGNQGICEQEFKIDLFPEIKTSDLKWWLKVNQFRSTTKKVLEA